MSFSVKKRTGIQLAHQGAQLYYSQILATQKRSIQMLQFPQYIIFERELIMQKYWFSIGIFEEGSENNYLRTITFANDYSPKCFK